MKDLLVCTRPSYLRRLMKLSWTLLCRSTFRFFAECEALWAFSRSFAATPEWVVGSGQIGDGTSDVVSL